MFMEMKITMHKPSNMNLKCELLKLKKIKKQYKNNKINQILRTQLHSPNNNKNKKF